MGYSTASQRFLQISGHKVFPILHEFICQLEKDVVCIMLEQQEKMHVAKLYSHYVLARHVTKRKKMLTPLAH